MSSSFNFHAFAIFIRNVVMNFIPKKVWVKFKKDPSLVYFIFYLKKAGLLRSIISLTSIFIIKIRIVS